MRRFSASTFIALFFAGIILCGCSDDGDPSDPGVVETEYGKVQGVVEEGFRAFLGIPYAAPPVGDLRWKSPQPHEGWSGVHGASAFGLSCPQPPYDSYGPSYGEDCLTLSVWTPYPVPDSPAPVMVWFHYGGFNAGSSFAPWSNGQFIADLTGTVVVSPNYRLGPLGFLAHPSLEPDSGNYGILDQRAALTWVKDNIAAFGGDPNNVTIFGSSAGSTSVCIHMVSAGSAGLFHRAIMESGACPHEPRGFLTKAEAETQGELLASTVGCDTAGDVATCLRAKPENELRAALTLLDPVWDTGEAEWAPIIDGTVLADQPLDSIIAGNFNQVPLVLGSNQDEGSQWFMTAQGMTEQDYTTLINEGFGTDAAAVLAMYPASDYATPATAASQLVGDAMFICPTRRTARAVSAAGVSTYLYYFTHPPHWSDAFHGVYHLAEIWIVFFAYKEEYGAHTEEEAAFSHKVMGYWTRFAATADPNTTGEVTWPQYSQATDEHIVLNPTIETGSNLKQAKCDFWDSLIP